MLRGHDVRRSPQPSESRTNLLWSWCSLSASRRGLKLGQADASGSSKSLECSAVCNLFVLSEDLSLGLISALILNSTIKRFLYIQMDLIYLHFFFPDKQAKCFGLLHSDWGSNQAQASLSY